MMNCSRQYLSTKMAQVVIPVAQLSRRGTDQGVANTDSHQVLAIM
eukprot:XP_001709795.1 Hypothetical protein GL50803_37025 [Giardia lamblia ATCC 50803]